MSDKVTNDDLKSTESHRRFRKRNKVTLASNEKHEHLLEVPEGWREPEFKPEDNPTGMLEESTFRTLFPKYREKYLTENWSEIQQKFGEHNIKAEMDRLEGSLSVSTTRRTRDPYAIMKARDIIRLLSRSVPFEVAVRVLQDDIACDIIRIGNLLRNKERFVKRRQRLLGPNGATLKALEILTQCYILVHGNTVSSIGPYKGLRDVRRVVEDCMRNYHPVYHIKTLMIKRELSTDEKMRGQSWDRFLPKFKSRNISKRKKPLKRREKKIYNPFPPPQLERKEDLLLETGEYFLKESEKKGRILHKKQEKQKEALQLKAKERANAFVAPKDREVTPATLPELKSTDLDISNIQKKIKAAKIKKPRIGS